jgi:hypothetical protein
MQAGFDFLKILGAFVAGAIAVGGLGAYCYFSRMPGLTIPTKMKRVVATLLLEGLVSALLFAIFKSWEFLVCAGPAIAFIVSGMIGGTYLGLRLRQWHQLQRSRYFGDHREDCE